MRFSPSDTARLHLILSRSSVIPWSISGRRSPRTPSIRRMPRCCQTSNTWRSYKVLSTIFSSCNKILVKWTSLLLISSLLSLNSAFCRSIKWCGILSLHYLTHINIDMGQVMHDSFYTIEMWCFSKMFMSILCSLSFYGFNHMFTL